MVAILNQKIPVFQSTLPREERHTSRFISLLLTLYFNPRSHERSDFDTSVTVSPIPYISIHAPTRGATTFFRCWNRFSIFQSTLPREERLNRIPTPQGLTDFNPRSHERSDSNIAQKICLFLYNTDNKYIIR